MSHERRAKKAVFKLKERLSRPTGLDGELMPGSSAVPSENRRSG